MNPDRTLTRYTSFTKFVSTIEQGFFIPKATLFEDELEGVLPYFKETDEQHAISKEQIRAYLDWIYISCWHSEKHESHAMWKIYGTSNEAVAIQTTELDFKLAVQKLEFNIQSYFDDVVYRNPNEKDFKKPKSVKTLNNYVSSNADGRAVYSALFSYLKHIGYEFEKETRFVAIDNFASCTKQNSYPGIYFEPDVSRKMIKKVLLHPYAPEYFEKLVKKIVQEKYQMDIEVSRSSLSEKFSEI